MKNEIIEAVKIWLGGIVLAILVGLFVWLYLEATPDQLSAESDILREEMKAKGLE